MGFSVISVFELVYFMTLRPYCDYWRRVKRHRPSFWTKIRRWNIHLKRKQKILHEPPTDKKSHDRTVFPYVD